MPVDPYRLPREICPSRYRLAIEPSLTDSTFRGTVSIHCEATAAVDQIVLNTNDLTLERVVVDGEPRPYEIDTELERLIIDQRVESGPLTIDIVFTGVLNDKLRGLYRSTYVDDNGQTQVIACTQMQPTDCRRAFPCFDEPDFKAIFEITLVVDDGVLAIANEAEASRTRDGQGRWIVSFEPTIPMSTYLVAIVVGRLEATPAIDVDGVPLRIVHVPGKGHLTGFALEIGQFALSWFRRYYGIDYPGGKIDMVALPDFAAGAMENLGCITYRESLLLIDLEASTQQEQQSVADVVAHELAHMWFGDLVTMRWWNGIWLNEAFATFMEVLAVDAFRPEWQRWTSFSLERSDAFETDSLTSTRTVEYPVLAPDDCEGMFDVLTYQKGCALLRMLQQYLGEERFQAGVNHYLRHHSYGNTETEDLWDAIETVTVGDGGLEPVRQLMDSWIWQPGFPLISASLRRSRLVLRQERFGFDPEQTDQTTYMTPIAVDVGGRLQYVLIDGQERVLEIGSAADDDTVVLVNAEGSGFVRIHYDDNLRVRLTATAIQQLTTIERYNLVDDAGAAFTAGRLSAADLLDFLYQFTAETELALWQIIGIYLRRLDRVVELQAQPTFQERVRRLLEPALDRLGWQPSPGESELDSKLRAQLVVLNAVIGHDTGSIEHCQALLDGAADDADPEMLAAATTVVATYGDEATFDRFVERFGAATTPQESLRNLYALAEFDDAALIQRAADFAFSSQVRAQNAPFLLGRCIANRRHGAVAWNIVRRHWQQANDTFPASSIIRMTDAVKFLNDPQVVADVQAFFGEHDIPQAAKGLQQVLERQRVNADVRRRESVDFSAALRQPTPGR